MAAQPPKPPVNLLKALQNQNKNQLQQKKNCNSVDIDDTTECKNNKYFPETLFDKTSTAVTDNGSLLHETDNNYCTNLHTPTNKTTVPICSNTTNQTNTASKKISSLISCHDTQSVSAPLLNKDSSCNCSNISIMHLFHEMKQEFPTIPDTIVAQCVNENCHQRENCIQMLKNELELNPTPTQSYPAKVLHPRNNSNNNNHNINSAISTKSSVLQKPPLQQKPPLKPIKPTRTAPLHPPIQQQQINNDIANRINSTHDIKITTNNNKQLQCGENKQSILNTTPNTDNTNVLEVNNNINNSSIVDGGESVERNLPRQRPTTLNLNTQLQKKQQQQRQRLNIQLQQRFQEQRNKQQQQQQQPLTQTTTYPTKPLRKAPLPPIAPKPAQFQVNHNINTSLNDSHSASSYQHTTTNSPLSESEISVSVSLSTPSPTASSPSSNNYNTIHHKHNKSTPTQSPTPTNQQHLQTKSPIRHRSVITLQPEPPYTRGYLYSPAASSSTSPASPSTAIPNVIQTTSSNSSPTSSAGASQKSFTSVNLTLRPPVSPTSNSAALQPSTIDITAGPGFSSASGGGKSLHYCSTSYDARLGYQQNFQITVTDEGGVFSACRILPQQARQTGINQQQKFHNNNVVTLQQNIQNSIQSPQGIESVRTTAVSENGNSGSGGGGVGIDTKDNKSSIMCLPPQQAVDDLTAETLQRQKKRRDRLAEELRARKKTLSQVEQDINLLTGHTPTEGLSERLDEEIRKLRRDCEAMLRSSSTFTQPPTQQDLSINYQPQQYHQQQYQQPQPFPRQRFARAPPRPPPPRQTSLDIIQHHSPSSSSTPITPSPASSSHSSFHNTNTPHQFQQQQSSYTSLPPPSYYHQQSAPPNPTTGHNDLLYTADHNGRESNDLDEVDDDDDYEYEEEIFEPWECSMCTFRNHPQLNICETCENVRILPGTLPNLSRALSSTTNSLNTSANVTTAVADSSRSTNITNESNTNSSISRNASDGLNVANVNLEHDTNLVQQQLQNFALHT